MFGRTYVIYINLLKEVVAFDRLYFIVEIMVFTQSLAPLLLTIAACNMEIAVLTSTEKQFGKMTEILISKRFSSTSK